MNHRGLTPAPCGSCFYSTLCRQIYALLRSHQHAALIDEGADEADKEAEDFSEDADVEDELVCPEVARCFLAKNGSGNFIPIRAA